MENPKNLILTDELKKIKEAIETACEDLHEKLIITSAGREAHDSKGQWQAFHSRNYFYTYMEGLALDISVNPQKGGQLWHIYEVFHRMHINSWKGGLGIANKKCPLHLHIDARHLLKKDDPIRPKLEKLYVLVPEIRFIECGKYPFDLQKVQTLYGWSYDISMQSKGR